MYAALSISSVDRERIARRESVAKCSGRTGRMPRDHSDSRGDNAEEGIVPKSVLASVAGEIFSSCAQFKIAFRIADALGMGVWMLVS